LEDLDDVDTNEACGSLDGSGGHPKDCEIGSVLRFPGQGAPVSRDYGYGG
jgi:hypothetical protein